MKNIFKYAIIILVLGGLISCDGYLENAPLSTTSPENFYKSPEEAEIALNGVYSILTATTVQGIGNQSTYSRNLMFMLNGATDECVSNNTGDPVLAEWGLSSYTSQNAYINQSWSFLYAGINRANYLIENLSNIDDFSGNRKIEVEAEAKLLRGFYHMILSMMHGGIPTYTTSIQDPNAPRASVEMVYNQILADYEFAYENLNVTSNLPGRVNKWTAGGLLAKAHTYLASMKNSGVDDFGLDINNFDWVDVDEHYQAALSYTTDVIASSGYILIPEYDRLFRETTKQDQYQECLLTGEGSLDANANVYQSLINAFIPQGNRDRVGGGYGQYRPLLELWDKYNDADVRKGHNITGNILLTASLETIDGYTYYVPRVAPNMNVAYVCIGKYRAINPDEKAYNNAFTATTLPLLRLADVLLLHAEAQYFLGDESGARTTLTALRERAVADGNTVADLDNAYFKTDFVEELLDERSRELCFENWRRIDLARFNKYDEVVNALSTDSGHYNSLFVPIVKQNWKPEKIWLPIPLDQIDLNEALTQNFGY